MLLVPHGKSAANPASTSPSALPDKSAATIGVAMRGGRRPQRSWRPWRARTLSSVSATEAGGNGSGDVRELLKLAGVRKIDSTNFSMFRLSPRHFVSLTLRLLFGLILFADQ